MAKKPCGACGTPLTQGMLNAWGAALAVHLTIVANQPGNCASEARFGFCHDARLTLVNQGPAFDGSGWALYLTNSHRVLRVEPGELGLAHVQGSLHVVQPTAAFKGFAASESKVLSFQADGCWIAESEGMPRAYLAAPGLTPVIIANTDTEDPGAWLTPLIDTASTTCSGLVSGELATAASRFQANVDTMSLGAGAVVGEVIPRPRMVTPGPAALDLSTGLWVEAPSLGAETLAAVVARLGELGVTSSPSGRVVSVTVDPLDAAFVGRASAEAYRLRVREGDLTIVGADAAGAFYGLETLLALVSHASTTGTGLPTLDVGYDAPRFTYRGLQLDVARNFHGPAVVERVLKQMAAYKLNALHIHLSDDEGFRLEIPGLPELTEVGARRCHDLDERTCLLPQLGSGPTADTSGSGHFSRAEFVSLLRLATALHIEVIPELDMPGHARAAIRAMALRAFRGDRQYALDDPDDASAHLSVQGYDDDVINGCAESTYAFVAKVMDEVISMYLDAGAPLHTWHVGGDEVPSGSWTASPICQALFASGGPVRGPSDVARTFARRVNALAQARALGLRLWGDGMISTTYDANGPVSTVRFDPSADFAGNEVSVNWYSPLRLFDNAPGPLTKAGYQVVLGTADYLYIDTAPESDPKERGSYWSTRSLSARKMFSFIPGNLAANAQLSEDCHDGACDYFFGAAVPVLPAENVLGMELAQWSETVRTDEQLEAMLFPRLLAFAERAWHRGPWEPADGMDLKAPIDRDALATDWQRFANTVGYQELPALDRAGVRYRIEVPGAQIVDGALRANVPFPGLKIEYRDSNGAFVPYDTTRPPAIAATEVRAITATGRAGRAVAVTAPPASR